jgi:hypothetical protein
MSSHETAELLATLGGLAESVSRIASALEANQLSSKNVLPYEGQPKLMEEEIALLKNQIKMKDAFMANVEVYILHMPPEMIYIISTNTEMLGKFEAQRRIA